jgi:hypothetical protein
MKDNKAKVIGLDIGTSRIVTARQAGEEYQFRAQLNAFVDLPFSKLTESVLMKGQIPFAVNGSEITVFGNESARFAESLGVEMRRPMTRGILNPAEPESLAQMRRIITAILGDEPGENSKVCFSVPAPPIGGEENATYHEASIRQILGELGYQAQSINEGLAVIYGELEHSNYTGVGVSCGGGLCNVALAYMSVPVLSFSTLKGGDFIDSSAASVTGELANRIRIAKETSFHFNGHYADKVKQVLSVYYDELIQSVVNGLKEAFQGSRNLPRIARPIPLVLGGGSSLPAGFRERFSKVLQDASIPVTFSEVRLAADPLTSTAKGALVAGLAD